MQALAPRRTPTPYRRRKPLAGIVVLSVLAITSVMVWTTTLQRASDATALTACPPPAAGTAPPASTALAYHALDNVAPAPAAESRVTVLNGSGQRGSAALVAGELARLGFPPASPPADDPAHPEGDLRCLGQIRFGPAGTSAARTLSLVVPCAQLVRDSRAGSTIDLALGTDFSTVIPTPEARRALDLLATAPTGVPTDGATPPGLTPALLNGARPGQC
ncbi:envelope integrity protein Cei [Amycolatopsis benzoatilytica]|uniref:envelope integrity protein Cei n=1 Tax=Amycolatopsis benzoatilytica TaxID=346045 RepID=UPI0003680E05|nr:envelope integrity protein Cei [Amycolatopsis benzoatilytica]